MKIKFHIIKEKYEKNNEKQFLINCKEIKEKEVKVLENYLSLKKDL